MELCPASLFLFCLYTSGKVHELNGTCIVRICLDPNTFLSKYARKKVMKACK